jgi:hypothetical protein
MKLNPRHANTAVLDALVVGLEDSEDGTKVLFSWPYLQRIL